MISYHGEINVKKKYVERFEAHRKLDQVIQGTGFDGSRGCFVGCTLDRYDHSGFEAELGWPQWLAYLADKIFEGLPKSEAPQFGSDLLAAVPVGVDLEMVRPMLGIKRMDRLLKLHADCDKYGLQDAILLVKNLHEAEINGCLDESAAESAWSAESAAWSAASAASSESAAWSAASAARSARSAESAESAESAWSAESAAYQAERDDLLSVLRELEAKSK